MNSRSAFLKSFFFAAVAAFALAGRPALAQNEALQADAAAALKALYATSPSAKALGETAVGVLVFPSVTRLGFIVGAQGGDGVLYQKGGKIAGYYNTGAMSVGLQAGIQSYGYALFFMRDEDLKYLKSTKGWSIGTGPTIVIADAGAAKDVSTLTGQQGVYGFIFDQKGLMAGMALTGQKITRIKR